MSMVESQLQFRHPLERMWGSAHLIDSKDYKPDKFIYGRLLRKYLGESRHPSKRGKSCLPEVHVKG
ncbi:hypothetical protein F2Q69_00005004 [Brassica cretica]|uniref:Uncharacterized protein n=1 Tax=Brassica cretica TaxID=69181 RepID=A0A8S9P0Y8_BRACR|nr:hypothetical protein F2Q69_00005004 [Brassica cretica]